jgi:hypothetical protein
VGDSTGYPRPGSVRRCDCASCGRTSGDAFAKKTTGVIRLQRQPAPPEKTTEEKYQAGAGKLVEAFMATPLGANLLEQVKQDALAKGAAGFISTLPGKIVTGAAATGAVAALAAAHKELPLQIPEIPLGFLAPGLSVKLTYKGPVDQPTDAAILFKYAPSAAAKGAADPVRADTARLRAEDARFRAGLRYTPGSREDLEQKEEQEAVRRAVLRLAPGPDLDAIIRKYQGLGAPGAPGGMQLTLPALRTGASPPALLGEELKLAPPDERKKRPDEPPLQKETSIGASDDPLELEADRVAAHVLAARAGDTAPVPVRGEARQASGQAGVAPARVDQVLGTPGTPLDDALRNELEPAFGYDLSPVRLHLGALAEQSAEDVSAQAYAVGHDIVFGAGQFAPGTLSGRRLLAHELAHVVQQSGLPGIRLGAPLRRQLLPVEGSVPLAGPYTGYRPFPAPPPAPPIPKKDKAPAPAPQAPPAPPVAAKCEEFPGGSTDCEVDANGMPTGKVTHRIDEANPCTRPCVEQHEAVHVKQLTTFCPTLRKCYQDVDKGKRPATDCFKMVVFEGDARECAAYKVSVPCVEAHLKTAKACQSPANREYGLRKLASEICFRNNACGSPQGK